MKFRANLVQPQKFLLLVLISLNAYSYPSFINTEESNHCEQQEYNTSEISEESQIINCIVNKQDKIQSELKSTYETVLSILTPQEQNLLMKNQKKWESLRDESCTFVKEIYQKENYKNLVEKSCINLQNKNRIYYLNAILNLNK